MTPQQIARYNNLMKRREQLANLIYVSDFAIFTNNGILLDAAVELAKKSINEIDFEIGKL
jgi:hypothetical protein